MMDNAKGAQDVVFSNWNCTDENARSAELSESAMHHATVHFLCGGHCVRK